MAWHSLSKRNPLTSGVVISLVLIDVAVIASRDINVLSLATCIVWPMVIGAVALWFFDRWSRTPRFSPPWLLLASLLLLASVELFNIIAVLMASVDA